MKLYWSYRSLPELAGLSGAEQSRIWKICRGKPYRQWRVWLVLFASAPLFVWGPPTLMTFVETDRRHAALFYGLAFVIFIIPGGLWSMLLWQAQMQLARRCIAIHRASICPTCGYDLRASPERCPECGTAVTRPATPV